MYKLSEKGFSFIEVILVLSIVTIISVMATVFYSRFLTQNSVANTTDHIVSQVRKAQTYSLMSKQTAGVWGVKYVTTPSKQLTFYLSGNSAFDENYSVNENITVSPNFDITFAHLTGVPAGATFPLTITISGNNTSKSVTINSQGVISRN